MVTCFFQEPVAGNQYNTSLIWTARILVFDIEIFELIPSFNIYRVVVEPARGQVRGGHRGGDRYGEDRYSRRGGGRYNEK